MRWPWLQDEVDRSCQKFAALLRSAPDAGAPVPGIDWTVGQLGAHVVTVPRRMRRMIEGERIELTDDMGPLNLAELSTLPTGDLPALADELEAAHQKLRLAWGDDGTRRLPWYHFDLAVTEMAGVELGELLVHGQDLAAALGSPWKMRRDQALAVTEGIFALAPHFLRQDVAAGLDVTIHLKLRGGPDYTVEVKDGACRVEQGRPERADLHVSADPVAYLEVAYGRRSQWPAVFTGRLVTWGRKPQLALTLGKLFRQP